LATRSFLTEGIISREIIQSNKIANYNYYYNYDIITIIIILLLGIQYDNKEVLSVLLMYVSTKCTIRNVTVATKFNIFAKRQIHMRQIGKSR